MPLHFALSQTRCLPTGLIVLITTFCLMGNASGQFLQTDARRESDAPSQFRWPKPDQLLEELSVFDQHASTAVWAQRTKEVVEHLCLETAVASDESVKALVALNRQSQGVALLIQQFANQNSKRNSNVSLNDGITSGPDPEAIEWISRLQRFQYRLDRRIEVWAGVIDYSNALSRKDLSPIRTVSLKRLPPNLDELLQTRNPKSTGWQDYLAWDGLVQAANTSNMDKKAKIALRKAARKFLARYHSPSLSPAQHEMLQSVFAPELLEGIRDAATKEVDQSVLMRLIELMEQKHSGKIASYLNSQYQDLLWSDDPVAQELAATIDTHWRNANFRVAINERLLNQMLPQVPATTEPVSESLQGAKISGQSLIQTDELRIGLIPNPNEISLRIETNGQVTSETTAKRSGFTFQNRGLADFKVLQKLVFSRTDITSEEPTAMSTARQRLIGLRGSYDRVPLLGRLSRKIAKQKADESTPEALELTRNRVETGAKQRVEQEVNQLVAQFRRGLQDVVLSKLIAMDLEPETVQLSTSKQRIVGRYRVAGRDQMAAWQPRPTDFESDLLTVQFHQSAVNNLVERFELNGQKFNAISLGKHIEKITGVPYQSKNADAEATFQFDKYDPVRIDFEDGIAKVQFKFKKFQVGKGRSWKNITVAVSFKPQYIGTRIVLDRDNQSAVKGKDLSTLDEIAIRGAFKVILEKQYAFDIMPAMVRGKIPNLALAIDRLSLADGWCGVAFDNASELNHPVPIVAPEEVVPGSWSDQLGSFQSEESRIETPRTARSLNY